MKSSFKTWSLLPCLLAAALASVSHAAPTDIANVPLITSAPNAVLPNLMFILDDSGSMNSDYLPDYVQSNRCRSSGATGTASGNFGASCTSEPPYRSPSYNGSYYNPEITYTPPLYANGTSWPTQNAANTASWTNVRNDAYGIQFVGSTNLVTGYGDVEYCTDNTYVDCLRNGNYVLPGTVNSKSYTFRRATTASGSGSIATNSPAAATVETRAFGPHYYVITPGEYCDAPNLRNCQGTQTTVFSYAAPVRWCNSDANARAAAPAVGSCQALQTPGYTNLRIPTKFFTPAVAGTNLVPETPATARVTVSLSGTCNNANQLRTGPLRVNGTLDLFNGSTTPNLTTNGLTNRQNELAGAIRTLINNGGTGYSATVSNNVVTIRASATAGNINGQNLSLTRVTGANLCGLTVNTVAFSGWAAEQPATPGTPAGFPGSFTRVDIIPATATYPRATTRSDCAAATTCTYDEEMTNFANWFTYYRTRMQSMKTSASLAFGNLSNQYRLGYMSINNATGSDFLNIDRFELTQKENWFTKLTSARPSGTTPLRGALSRVGRLFGGRLNGTSLNGSTVVDPMQYSCQQNFTLLSTDGYWNESGTPTRLDGSTAIGDVDSALPRPLLDGTATSNTLADVAAYYYETDLRTGTTSVGLCRSATGGDLCENNVPTTQTDVATHQHMTTFTLGLGVSGYMLFDESYSTSGSGDYSAIKNGVPANPTNGVCTWQTTGGTCNWPIPVNNSTPNIDDLWHAAVNGRGTYFSAKDPAALYSGLAAALASIQKRDGAAAAATTSNPNITAQDNFVFLSLFTSGKDDWTGELLGQQINTADGTVVAQGSDWSARTLLDANNSRRIYTFDSGATNGLKSFEWGNLTSTEQSYFLTTHLTTPGRALSQFCSFGTTCLSPTDQAAAVGAPLVNYLRGDRSNEGIDTNVLKFYRVRKHLLGDIVNSEATYVKKALFNYADAGYTAFKASTANRRAMVYVGANDGMLHAFDAATGAEVWAYIPTMVIPKLYRLADKNYGNDHQFYVDSSPVSGDIAIGGAWRTILVGGLGAGGRGYYAMDITDPDNPRALWEFTDNNLGLTVGKPEITKLKDGTWVVIFASGYNNVSPGDGNGRLYVVRASDGQLLRTITTASVGTMATPSGLAHIRAWVDRTDVNNTTLRVYGGDNLGNVWRFDVNGDVGAGGYDAQLLATLRDSFGNAQPLTARPELGLVSGRAVVYVGTGRYLGVTDLSDDKQQTIYAIKDPLNASNWGNPRSSGNFVQQTLTDGTCPAGTTVCLPSQTVRFGSANPVDFTTGGGWYIDLPARSERANTDPQLALGTLVFTTNIINPGACTVGGTSYINFFDYRTGGPVTSSSGVTSALLGGAVATRPTIIRLPGGRVVAITRLSDASTRISNLPIGPGSGGTRRISWRELTN